MTLSVSTAVGNGTTMAIVAQPIAGWLVGDTLLAYVASDGDAPVHPVGWTSVASTSNGSIFFSLFSLLLTTAQGGTTGSPFVLDQSTLDSTDVLASIGQFAFTAPAADAITVLVVEYPSALVGGIDRASAVSGVSAAPFWPSLTPTYNGELVCLAMLTITPGTDSTGTPFTLDQSTLDGTDVLTGQLTPTGYALDGTSVVGVDFVLDQSTLDSTDLLGSGLYIYNFDAQQGAASPTGTVVAGAGASGPWCTIGLALLPAQLAVYYVGVQFRFDLIR